MSWILQSILLSVNFLGGKTPRGGGGYSTRFRMDMCHAEFKTGGLIELTDPEKGGLLELTDAENGGLLELIVSHAKQKLARKSVL